VESLFPFVVLVLSSSVDVVEERGKCSFSVFIFILDFYPFCLFRIFVFICEVIYTNRFFVGANIGVPL